MHEIKTSKQEHKDCSRALSMNVNKDVLVNNFATNLISRLVWPLECLPIKSTYLDVVTTSVICIIFIYGQVTSRYKQHTFDKSNFCNENVIALDSIISIPFNKENIIRRRDILIGEYDV